MPKYLTEIRMKQHPDGRVTCLKCNYTWRMFKPPKDRRCRNCRCAMWPAPMIEDTHCHWLCRDGLCSYLVMDWAVVRQSWRAVPGKSGVVWKLADAHPFTIHDIMIAFKIGYVASKNWIDQSILKQWLYRERKKTPPPEEVQKYKGSYNIGKGMRLHPAYRTRKAAYFRYYPTHWAMKAYISRFPDKVKMVDKGGELWWNPTNSRKVKTLVKYTPICLPRTLAERKAIGLRLQNHLTHNKVGLPVSRQM